MSRYAVPQSERGRILKNSYADRLLQTALKEAQPDSFCRQRYGEFTFVLVNQWPSRLICLLHDTPRIEAGFDIYTVKVQ
jgi:hypothetical protein